VTTAIDYLALAALVLAIVWGSVAAATSQVGLGTAVIAVGLLGVPLKIYLIRAKAKVRRRQP
jgi:hypothetical protein